MSPFLLWRVRACAAAWLMMAGSGSHAEVLTLAQAIARSMEHNSDARLAAMAVDSARAAGLSAAAAPNPTLTLQSFNINPGVGIGSGKLREKTIDSAVRIDQLIERGGKRELRVATAGHLERAARDDLREGQRQLRLQVSLAYYDWQAAIARLAVLRDSAALCDATVEAARRRLKAGDLAAADVARAAVDALRARNDVQQAETDVAGARIALMALLGEPERNDVEAAPAGVLAAPSELVADDAALARRPDVLAAQDRLDAAYAARKLALAQRSTDVTVGLQVEHYPASAANPQGSGNSYGIALQIPLQWRYTYQGEIRTAEVAIDIASENLDKVRRLARAELLLGSEQVQGAWQRLRRSEDELLPSAHQSAIAGEYAFNHGALSIMDVLDVRRSERAAQLETLAARNDYAKSLAAWRAALTESSLP
ncbi:TolC family protein [Duganella sp. Dugasp56]|uniref:TolC family protein n=1 Tax=Duganella sp. Dugasp56 TaxID=3243046 RepID=UPI0039AEC718